MALGHVSIGHMIEIQMDCGVNYAVVTKLQQDLQKSISLEEDMDY